MLYQYFDAQEIKLKNRLLSLERIPIDRLSINDLREIETIKIKIEFLRQIYCNLTEFILEL